MKKLALLVFLCFYAATARAQSLTRSLTAQGAECGAANASSLILKVSTGVPISQVAFALSGTFSGTVTFKATANGGATWTAFSVTPSGGGSGVTTATAVGSWSQSAGAYTGFCVLVSTFSSGTFVATINLSNGGSGGGGGGTIGGLIAANQIAVGTASDTIGGDGNFTYNPSTFQSKQVDSCGLTLVGESGLCGPGLGTSYGSPAAPVLQEIIQTADSELGTCWLTAGAGNTGTARDNYVCMNSANTEGTSILFQKVAGQPISTLTDGIQFGPNGTLSLGVQGSGLTQTVYQSNGDIQQFTPIGKGICTQGTTSGQACYYTPATGHTITILPANGAETTALVDINNAATANGGLGDGLSILRGNGIPDALYFTTPSLLTVVQNDQNSDAIHIHNLSGPASNNFFMNVINSGAGQLSLSNAVNQGTIEFKVDGSIEIDADPSTGGTSIGGAGIYTVIDPNGNVTAPAFRTTTNCSSSATPAVCGSASAGAVALPTGTGSTLTINTSAVTASSEIRLQIDDSLTVSGATCNTTLATLVGTTLAITARSAGVSFTVSTGATTVIATNPVCFSYTIVN